MVFNFRLWVKAKEVLQPSEKEVKIKLLYFGVLNLGSNVFIKLIKEI